MTHTPSQPIQAEANRAKALEEKSRREKILSDSLHVRACVRVSECVCVRVCVRARCELAHNLCPIVTRVFVYPCVPACEFARMVVEAGCSFVSQLFPNRRTALYYLDKNKWDPNQAVNAYWVRGLQTGVSCLV